MSLIVSDIFAKLSYRNYTGNKKYCKRNPIKNKKLENIPTLLEYKMYVVFDNKYQTLHTITIY